MAFSLLISVVFILILFAYSWVIEDNIFNRLVASEAKYIEDVYQDSNRIVQPRIPFMQLYSDWSDLPENIQLLREQSPDRVEFPLNSRESLHLTTLDLGNSQKILAANVGKFEVSRDYLPKITQWIVGVLICVSLLTYLISHYLTKQVVRPIRNISQTIRSYKEGQVFGYDDTFAEDEIGYLASNIELSVNRLQRALTRETQFTRDISHELRTPAAVLKMLSEKMQTQGALSEESQARLSQSVLQIEQTLSVLLALAREESMDTEKLSLKEEIEHCIINHPVIADFDNIALALDISPNARVIANKNLFHILINNLLDNAVNHASEVEIFICANPNQLEFSNPVESSFDGDLFDDGIKSSSSSGLGLGLYLVNRICEKMGWHVAAHRHDSRFVLKVNFD